MERDDLTPANIIFDDGRGVIIVNEFADKATAMDFIKEFNEEKTVESEFKALKIFDFVISDKNFKTLYQTKELNTYLKFYRNNY